MKDESGYFRLLDNLGGRLPFNKAFECPGCGCNHGLNDTWQLTFNDGKPTVNPSILVRHHRHGQDVLCHLFIRNGRIEYLNDSTHELAGKTVEMKKWED